MIGLLTAAGVLVALRPLLLTTLDSELASVRGVPARALGVGFLAAPAGAAHRLTASPYRGLALSALIAVFAVCGGLALSYWISALPPSSAIIGLAGSAYFAAVLITRRG